MTDPAAAPAGFVILAARPGVFHTDAGPAMRAVETWEYVFYGRTRARFVIADLGGETRVTVVDEGAPPTFSQVPAKLLKKYASIAEARRELEQLVAADAANAALVRVEP